MNDGSQRHMAYARPAQKEYAIRPYTAPDCIHSRAVTRSRTPDLQIRNLVLYPLSYERVSQLTYGPRKCRSKGFL